MGFFGEKFENIRIFRNFGELTKKIKIQIFGQLIWAYFACYHLIGAYLIVYDSFEQYIKSRVSEKVLSLVITDLKLKAII